MEPPRSLTRDSSRRVAVDEARGHSGLGASLSELDDPGEAGREAGIQEGRQRDGHWSDRANLSSGCVG